MPQIEKPDDLQLIANLIRFFCVCMTIASMMEISQKRLAANLTERLCALIYQVLHLAKTLSFTDTSMRMENLSVNGLLEKRRLRTK